MEVEVAKYSRGQGADLKVIHYCALANKLQVSIILLYDEYANQLCYSHLEWLCRRWGTRS
jgi:hypothetical protein